LCKVAKAGVVSGIFSLFISGLSNAAPIQVERFRTFPSDPRGIALAIEAACEGESVVFKVSNTGGTWPATGVFALYDGRGEPVRQWTRRLTAGQTITFVRPMTPADRSFGLRIDPTWNGAAPRMDDARIACS